MKKNTKIIIAVLVVCLILATILLIGNRDLIAAGKLAQEQETLTIKVADSPDLVLTKADILALPASSFEAVIRSSSSKPENVEYTGVRLTDLMALVDEVDPATVEQFVFIGADGYQAVVTAREYAEREDLYIVYAMNGEELASRQEGGFGPYQFVAVADSFSQRWCKYLSEVQLNR